MKRADTPDKSTPSLKPNAASPGAPTIPSKRSYIELLRIVACFLVIVNHTNWRIFEEMAPSPTWFASLTYFFLCKPAVPIFLMIMGALLLGKQDSFEKSVERFFRIAVILILSTVCYCIYYEYHTNHALSMSGLFLRLLKALKSPCTSALGYLYLYLALLCLLPILQKLIAVLTKQNLQWLLLLSLVVLGTLPVITAFFPWFQLYHRLTSPFFSTHIAMVLLGYYIEHYMPITRRSFWISGGLLALLTVFQVAGTYVLYQRDPSSYLLLDSQEMITVTASAACLFIMAKYISSRFSSHPKAEHAVLTLGGLTFGIYLLGDFMISLSEPLYTALCRHIHCLPAMFIWELLIFTAGALITAALKTRPFFQKWL